MLRTFIGHVLTRPEFENDPPICIDVGASGQLPREWKLIAPYSVCVAFDADTREFTTTDSRNEGWRRLVKINRMVTDGDEGMVPFFLTASPFCSSSLKPDHEALQSWAFADLFNVVDRVNLPAVTLASALQDLEISRIDWFKTDSQGMDLRLFAALPAGISDRTIVADFEPGIIDAYGSEDKLSSLLVFMEKKQFFMSDMRVFGSQRIPQQLFQELGALQRRGIASLVKTSPGWTEVSYMNTFKGAKLSVRDLLLGWVFASIKGQHGHALYLSSLGRQTASPSLFEECRVQSLKQIRRGYPSFVLRGLRSLIGKALRA